jgi:hypothetical protein
MIDNVTPLGKRHGDKASRQKRIAEKVMTQKDTTPANIVSITPPEPDTSAPPTVPDLPTAQPDKMPDLAPLPIVHSDNAAKSPKPKKKGPSLQVQNWKKQPAFAESQVITILVAPDNEPKSGEAQKRFAHYENGMTVKGYIDVMKLYRSSRSRAQAMDDIRWDYVAGFIAIDGTSYPKT